MVTVLGLYGALWMTPDHEASAVIVRDGEIIAAMEEDRITRVKHDGQTPNWNSLKEVLRISGVKSGEIDAVAIPWESPEEVCQWATSPHSRSPSRLSFLTGRPGTFAGSAQSFWDQRRLALC